MCAARGKVAAPDCATLRAVICVAIASKTANIFAA